MTAANLEPRDLFGNAVGATLVTALYARTKGAECFGVDDWDDRQARQAWLALDALAGERGIHPEDLALTDQVNVVGTIRRSQAMDVRVREFAGRWPDGQVVSLGLGLCNRAARLADLELDWIGVDHPDVVALRQRLLPDDATRLIPGSVTEREWLSSVDADRPTLFVAEGLLMYLERPVVAQLLTRLADHQRGPCRLIADVHHALAARGPALITRLTGAVYGFGVTSPAAFAALSPGWRLVGVDDTMAPISPGPARVSRLFTRLTGSLLYGVLTLDKDAD